MCTSMYLCVHVFCARERVCHAHSHVLGQSRIVIRNLLEHSPSNSRYSRSVSSSYTREPLDEEMIVLAKRLL